MTDTGTQARARSAATGDPPRATPTARGAGGVPPPPGAAPPGTAPPGGRNPLLRNAYALMVNTGISAVLGLGYWVVAARYYTDEAVGQGSAAIAAMKFLAGLTAVTLIGALARFIPTAGRGSRRLILRVYAGSSLLVAVAAVAFLLTLDLWGPSYGFLRGWLPGLGFVAAVVAWSVLTLQDGVLTGLRSAVWVPVGNTAFSTVKLVLLVLLAAAVPATGVFVSWALAIAVSVVPLCWLIFRRLIPRHMALSRRGARPPGYREMGRFLAGDYTGALFSLAVVYLVPVLVAAQVSSADNAYFYITVTIAGTINLLGVNMGASLTVEGAHDPARLAANCRAALLRMARIMLPVCAVLFFLAPQVLGVFGPEYAQAASPVLRWYAVAALLRAAVEVYFAVLRAQSRTTRLAVLQGVLCALVLTLTLTLLPLLGLVGAGIAEAVSLALVAVVAVGGLHGVLRPTPKRPPDHGPADDGPADDGPADDGPEGGGPAGEGPAGDGPTGEGTAAGDPAPAGPTDGVDGRAGGRAGTAEGEGVSVGGGPGQRTGRGAVAEDGDLADLGLGARTGAAPAESPRRGRIRPGAPEGVPARRRRGALVGLWALLVSALALYWVPLRGVGAAEVAEVGGLGLVEALPSVTLAGGALLVLCFAAALRVPGPPPRALLAAVLVATVVALHAVPALLESEPRFATAWQHLGFLDYLDRTGATAPDLDARWSWPGFFAVAAFVAQAAGSPDLTELIRWWPLGFQLACLAPLALLLRAVDAGPRAKWCALWFFVLCGWVGQDYFSPQAFTYLLHLCFLAILLVWLRPAGAAAGGRRRPGEAPVPPVSPGTRAVLLGVVLLLFLVSVASHQLTPFVMLAVVTGLVLVRRSTLYGLPLLGAVLVAAWVCYLAEPYWSGHFDDLFGGIGGFGANLSTSVSGRVEGGSDTHKLVLYVRMALAAGLLGLAALGLLRRRRLGIGERALTVVAGVPFLAFGLQSYGGEMALRVFLFALPAACVLAALAFFPHRAHPDSPDPAAPPPATAPAPDGPRPGAAGWVAPGAALLAGLVLFGGFLVARWGNEAFEQVRPGEVAAMEHVYAHDRPTVRLLWLSGDPQVDVTPALPWGARDMERVLYRPVEAPRDPAEPDDLVAELRAAGPNSYLVVNRGQARYLELDSGFPADWAERLRAALRDRPELVQTYADEDAALYTLREPPAGEVPQPLAAPPGPRVTWTDWSAAGALAAVILVVLLAAREFVRVLAPPGPRREGWLDGMLWFSVPLLMLTVASMVYRFLTLS